MGSIVGVKIAAGKKIVSSMKLERTIQKRNIRMRKSAAYVKKTGQSTILTNLLVQTMAMRLSANRVSDSIKEE